MTHNVKKKKTKKQHYKRHNVKGKQEYGNGPHNSIKRREGVGIEGGFILH